MRTPQDPSNIRRTYRRTRRRLMTAIAAFEAGGQTNALFAIVNARAAEFDPAQRAFLALPGSRSTPTTK